jgi:taurine dehydrogenase small subunit
MQVRMLRPGSALIFAAAFVGCQSSPQTTGAPSKGAAPEESRQVQTSFLEDFADAWNRHDVDALMSMMTDDCVYESSGGSQVDGENYEGTEAVRKAFASIFEAFPDAHWGDARHVVSGNRGFSEWTFTGTQKDGRRVEVNGCDLFVFRDGKIAVKNSFRKNRPPIEK